MHYKSFYSSDILHRTADYDPREERFRIRMLEIVGLTTKTKHGFSLFRKSRLVLGKASEGNSIRVGDERYEFPLGCSESDFGFGGLRFGFVNPTRFLETDGREWAGGEELDSASGGSEPRLGRRVRDSLRVELGAGIGLRRRADGSVATLRGAAGEPGHVGGGNEDCFADERV